MSQTALNGTRPMMALLSEAASTPVAVTRHGQTVGYFIPAHGQDEAQTAALKKASEALDRLLADHGVDADEVVSEFKAARRASAGRGKAGAKPA